MRFPSAAPEGKTSVSGVEGPGSGRTLVQALDTHLLFPPAYISYTLVNLSLLLREGEGDNCAQH